jgi:hypothetical protein
MTWKDQLNHGLSAFGVQIPDNLPLDQLVSRLSDNPCRNTAAVVALSRLLFYADERDHNPKVNDIFDASIYSSTCLSVGYGDIFARTQLGKLVGTTLMTIGPALSNTALDGAKSDRSDETQEVILRTLKQILQRLPQEAASPESAASASSGCLSDQQRDIP